MRLLPILLAAVSLTNVGSVSAQPASSQGVEHFETKIRPILVEHCYRCHSEEARKKGKLKAELLLDSKAGVFKGGVSGPALAAGKSAESLLLKALRHEGDLHMPPSGKLPQAVLNDFETWIRLGAADPRDGKQPAVAAELDWTKARQFWAFQAPAKSPPPKVKNLAWPRRDIDHFILAELEKRDLKPVGWANKRDLLRRATFDLIGLPPTLEELDAFLKDETADAFAKVVDRLLASPHYGERWGRYWLDVARYAEDKALAFANTRPHAYRYRDWVVQALNSDMPYDRFVRLQIAGDLMGDAEGDAFVKLAGLGFQGLGQEYHRGSVAAQVMADELDDRVDTLSRGLLGLTVACARCHDHKYDPIPTLDYYSLAAAYQGSSLAEMPASSHGLIARFNAWQKEVMAHEGKMTQLAGSVGEAAFHRLTPYLLAAWKLHVLREHKMPLDEAMFARQENLQPYFLNRLVKLLDIDEKKAPAILKPWLATANKARSAARAANTEVEIPNVLNAATDNLELARRKALQDRASNKLDPEHAALLKTLWLDANAPFAVNVKDLPAAVDPAQRNQYDALKKDADDHQKAAPPAPVMVHGINGGGTPMRVHQRGNVERLGEAAPPGFLRVLAADQAGAKKFTRLELASAIATTRNPLTARVIVNRVWHYHFGRGIVGTTSNFGQLGDRPTHPELLDTLAVRFMETGWSLRWLHREMMLSSAYQLASSSTPANVDKDPENHYLWRYAPRRLDFEAWRDAWLAVSGRLDAARGGPSIELTQADNVRRTLYAKVSRLEPNKLLVLFDFPDANVTSDRRSVTTVPQQQLFVLNSDFTIETAKAFARRLEKSAPGEENRIALAFRLAYGREPSRVETLASLEFLRDIVKMPAQDRLSPWEQFAQAILASNEFAWMD